MPPGRPTIRTPDVEAFVLTAIAEGKSLRWIGKQLGAPSMSTILRWADQDEAFRKQYAHARAQGLDAVADEMLEIADDGTNDLTTVTDASGNDREVLNVDHVQRSKLRVDTRKWLLSKLAPKKYGDRVATELSGPDGGPVQVQNLADLLRLASTPDTPGADR